MFWSTRVLSMNTLGRKTVTSQASASVRNCGRVDRIAHTDRSMRLTSQSQQRSELSTDESMEKQRTEVDTQALLKREMRRYEQERAEYKRKLASLRRDFAEEYARKRTEEEKRKKAKAKTTRQFPSIMLPVIDPALLINHEQLVAQQKQRREEKKLQREKLIQKLQEEKKAQEIKQQQLYDKLQGEVDLWISSEDLANNTLESKVDAQLGSLVGFQEPFKHELPKDPLRLAHLFPDSKRIVAGSVTGLGLQEGFLPEDLSDDSSNLIDEIDDSFDTQELESDEDLSDEIRSGREEKD